MAVMTRDLHLIEIAFHVQDFDRRMRKPPYTYTELITQALKDQTALTVSGIYNWIT